MGLGEVRQGLRGTARRRVARSGSAGLGLAGRGEARQGKVGPGGAWQGKDRANRGLKRVQLYNLKITLSTRKVGRWGIRRRGHVEAPERHYHAWRLADGAKAYFRLGKSFPLPARPPIRWLAHYVGAGELGMVRRCHDSVSSALWVLVRESKKHQN